MLSRLARKFVTFQGRWSHFCREIPFCTVIHIDLVHVRVSDAWSDDFFLLARFAKDGKLLFRVVFVSLIGSLTTIKDLFTIIISDDISCLLSIR